MNRTDIPTVVCFDLGGVVVRICRSWAEACELAKLPVRDLDSTRSGNRRAQRQALVDGYQSGTVSCDDYFEGLSGAFDGQYTPAEVELIHRVWTREQYPGVQSLITELNTLSGVTTACLSNTNHAHWLRLSGEDRRGEYPAVRLLQRRLASHLMGCLKPDAEIYSLAHDTLTGGDPRARIVFFDDLPENVAAARAHGWSAFQVDPLGDTAAQMRRTLREYGVR